MAGTGPKQQEPDGANIARVYDHLLGGSHNFPADQAAAEDFRSRWPEAPATRSSARSPAVHNRLSQSVGGGACSSRGLP